MKNSIFWLDQLTFKALWKVVCLKKGGAHIRYFKPASRWVETLTQLIFLCFGHGFKLSKVDYDLSFKDPSDGEALFWHINRDFSAFGEQAVKASRVDYLVSDTIKDGYDKNTVSLFLKRQAGYDCEKILGIFRIVNYYKSIENPSESEHVVIVAGNSFENFLTLWAAQKLPRY